MEPIEEVEALLSGGEWSGPAVPEVSGEMVKRAANSFKNSIGLGHCGWHPKVFTELLEAGLSATAELIMLVEQARRWPQESTNIDLMRLQKDGGGHRLIGLLPAIYRIWGKLRRPQCGMGGGASG